MGLDLTQPADAAIVGAGAAGLMAAHLISRHKPGWRTVLLEGTSKPATKLLLAGGGRCNVTNQSVTAEDYCGSTRSLIRRILAAFTVRQTVDFLDSIGVPLREEEDGKLFPETGNAHSVRNALLEQIRKSSVTLLTNRKTDNIQRGDDGFFIESTAGPVTARRVLLTTGGLSYPRTGSDGSGYRLATSLGHSVVPTTPALVPLVLQGRFHTGLSGISHEVELTLSAGGKPVRTRGALLWTHFGISGPAVLDISGHWLRARLNGLRPALAMSFFPGETLSSLDEKWIGQARTHPRKSVRNALAAALPARICDAVLGQLNMTGSTSLAHLPREDRRRLLKAVLSWLLPVRDSRGYEHAEVTAGGVPLKEINTATMGSRGCPGLFLAGEILDVDGRVGGFNLQWAWSSAWVAARGMAMDNVPTQSR